MPQSAKLSGVNADLPPFRSRVDSSDQEEQERPAWPRRRQHIKFDDGDYKQDEDVESEPPRRRKRERCSANPLIDADAGADEDARGEKEFDDVNDDLDGFIVADDIEV